MPAPNRQQLESFYATNKKVKINALWGYLYKGESMETVGLRIFPGDSSFSASQKVSEIMRCFGFDSEQYKSNRGIFAKWHLSDGSCVKEYIESEDVEAFVKAFPRGCSFTGRGEEMEKYIIERLEKKLAQIKKKLAGEKAAADANRRAENEKRRMEEEMRRQRAEKEALLRRKQAEEEARIRAQIQEERKLAAQYAINQTMAKAQAGILASEAAECLKNAQNYSDFMVALIKYNAAFSITWEEDDMLGISKIKMSLNKSDFHDYLTACEKMALQAYLDNDMSSAMLFCEMACTIPEKGSIEMDIFAQTFGKRDSEFHPEVTCLEVMRRIYIGQKDYVNAEYICKLEERAIVLAKMKVEEVVCDIEPDTPELEMPDDLDMPELEIPDDGPLELEMPDEDWDENTEPETASIKIDVICGTEEIEYEKYDDNKVICKSKPEIQIHVPMSVCSNPVYSSGNILLLAKDNNDNVLVSVGNNPFSGETEVSTKVIEGLDSCSDYNLFTANGELFAHSANDTYKLVRPPFSNETVKAVSAVANIGQRAVYEDSLTIYASESAKIFTSNAGGLFVTNSHLTIAYPEMNHDGCRCSFENGLIVENRGTNCCVCGVWYNDCITQWYSIYWK